MAKKKKIISKNIAFITLLIAIVSSIYYLNSMKAKLSDIDPLTQDSDIREFPKETDDQKQEHVQSDYIVDEEVLKEKSSTYLAAPELRGIAGYINTESGIRIQDLKGKVVLVDFWTYTCINCIRTFPYIKSWHDKYKDEGLVIIGVHTPEFNFEKKYENVVDATKKYGLKYPIVQDNDYATWHAYNNRFWPRKYLIDIDGFIRYNHIGEGSYEETELVIRQLLDERMERLGQAKLKEEMAKPNEIVDVDFGKIETPEIYLGYEFIRGNFGNKEGLQPNQIIDYEIPAVVKPNNIYLGGKWKINEDNSELVGDEGRIILGYNAKVVNIVASSAKDSEIEIFVDTRSLNESQIGADVEIIDGKSVLTIKDERLYNLVDYEYGPGLLEIIIKGKGFKIYTFTFG